MNNKLLLVCKLSIYEVYTEYMNNVVGCMQFLFFFLPFPL